MMSTTDVDLVGLLSEDRSVIIYRPRLNQITGSVLSSILLVQILYWWRKTWPGHQPCTSFYKFLAPPASKRNDYKSGDSWQEELGFSRHELQTALKRIAKKITTGVSKSDELEKNIVIYWTDKHRRTWFAVNERLLHEKLASLYNAGNRHYIDNVESSDYTDNSGLSDYMGNAENPHYMSSQTTSQTTPETNDAPEVALRPSSTSLDADTPGSRHFFEKLGAEYRVKNRRAPTRFKSLANKEKFVESEQRLGTERLEAAISRALEKGIMSITGATDFIAKFDLSSNINIASLDQTGPKIYDGWGNEL